MSKGTPNPLIPISFPKVKTDHSSKTVRILSDLTVVSLPSLVCDQPRPERTQDLSPSRRT